MSQKKYSETGLVINSISGALFANFAGMFGIVSGNFQKEGQVIDRIIDKALIPFSIICVVGIMLIIGFYIVNRIRADVFVSIELLFMGLISISTLGFFTYILFPYMLMPTLVIDGLVIMIVGYYILTLKEIYFNQLIKHQSQNIERGVLSLELGIVVNKSLLLFDKEETNQRMKKVNRRIGWLSTFAAAIGIYISRNFSSYTRIFISSLIGIIMVFAFVGVLGSEKLAFLKYQKKIEETIEKPLFILMKKAQDT
jgi:hypothetical protein